MTDSEYLLRLHKSTAEGRGWRRGFKWGWLWGTGLCAALVLGGQAATAIDLFLWSAMFASVIAAMNWLETKRLLKGPPAK